MELQLNSKPKLFLGKAFIATSYQDKEAMQPVTDAIITVLKEHDYEPVIFIRRQQVNMNEFEVMEAAFADIDNCTLLVADLTNKPTGVGIEMGYAAKKGIPVIGIRAVGSESSTTMEGTLSTPVREYNNATEIPKILSELLEPFVQKEYERRIRIQETVNPKLLAFVLEASRQLRLRYYTETDFVDTIRNSYDEQTKIRIDQYLELIFAKEFCIAMRTATDNLVDIALNSTDIFSHKEPECWEGGGAYFGSFEIIEVLIFNELRSRFRSDHEFDELKKSRGIEFWIWRAGDDGKRKYDLETEINRMIHTYPKEGKLTRAAKK